jgi:hypothetical protein
MTKRFLLGGLAMLALAGTASGQTRADTADILVLAIGALNAKAPQPARMRPTLPPTSSLSTGLYEGVIERARISKAAPDVVDGPCRGSSLTPALGGCEFVGFESLVSLTTVKIAGTTAIVDAHVVENGPIARQARQSDTTRAEGSFPVPNSGVGFKMYAVELKKTGDRWEVVAVRPSAHANYRVKKPLSS